MKRRKEGGREVHVGRDGGKEEGKEGRVVSTKISHLRVCPVATGRKEGGKEEERKGKEENEGKERGRKRGTCREGWRKRRRKERRKKGRERGIEEEEKSREKRQNERREEEIQRRVSGTLGTCIIISLFPLPITLLTLFLCYDD